MLDYVGIYGFDVLQNSELICRSKPKNANGESVKPVFHPLRWLRNPAPVDGGRKKCLSHDSLHPQFGMVLVGHPIRDRQASGLVSSNRVSETLRGVR